MPAIDERLNPLILPLRGAEGDADRGGPAGAAADADAVRAGVRHWADRSGTGDPLLLVAPARPTRERAFAAICAALGLLPCAIEAADIPGAPADREQLARLWSREAALHGAGAA